MLGLKSVVNVRAPPDLLDSESDTRPPPVRPSLTPGHWQLGSAACRGDQCIQM